MLLNNILNIPVQILALDKRKELWSSLVKELLISGFSEIHPFIAGSGKLLDVLDYDIIDGDQSLITQWEYGTNSTTKYRHWCAYMAHRQMIKKAKFAKWPAFIMMEDDACITKRFSEMLSQNVEIPSFDLLYLGWWKERNVLRDSESRWEKERTVNVVTSDPNLTGLHAVVISESMYDRILDDTIDTNPVDIQLKTFKDVKRYIVEPRLIHLKSCYSNCEDANFERESL